MKILKSTVLFSLITILFSCNTDELENKIIELEKEKMEVSIDLEQRESEILNFVSSMNEIEANLAKIKDQENVMATRFDGGRVELNTPLKDQIISDIDLINTLLLDNKEKMEALKAQLRRSKKNSSLKIDELEKMIEGMANRIQEKDAEIADLRVKLSDANAQLKVLFEEYGFRLDEIAVQQDQLNTGYYCFGTSKELKKKGVISKKGGIIGIGRTSKLSQDFNKEYFTQVDISLETEIALLSKKAKIITNHPADAYELSPDKLIIKDAKSFWSASKYLVIVVN